MRFSAESEHLRFVPPPSGKRGLPLHFTEPVFVPAPCGRVSWSILELLIGISIRGLSSSEGSNRASQVIIFRRPGHCLFREKRSHCRKPLTSGELYEKASLQLARLSHSLQWKCLCWRRRPLGKLDRHSSNKDVAFLNAVLFFPPSAMLEGIFWLSTSPLTVRGSGKAPGAAAVPGRRAQTFLNS